MNSILEFPAAFTFAAAIGAALGVSFIMRYLQRGQVEASFTRKEIELLRAELKETKEENFKPRDIIKRVELLRNEFSHFKNDLSHITEEERTRIVESLKDSLTGDAAEEVLNSLRNEIQKELESRNKQSIVEQNFEATIGRLREELYSLTRRSNLNLALGIVTTVIGLAILGYFVLYTPTSFEQPIDFFESFAPRLSLVIFIEIFAFFFLRLYKDTLSEIKYFQNEITNIESKHLAVSLAIECEENGGVLSSIDGLLNTERNHVLERGQTTIDIERRKLENSHDEPTIRNLIAALKGKSK